MVMYFFFNDTTTEMLTETKGSNREIEAPFEDETDEMMKDIFMDLRKKLDEVKARCDTYRRERDEARTLAARRLKRCRELEERNARLEADHERHKDSLVCLTDRLTALERENKPEDRHRPPLRRMRRVRTAGRRYDDADRRSATQLLPRLAPRERKPPARCALQPRADGAQTGPQII